MITQLYGIGSCDGFMDLPIPGNVIAIDRFQRTAYYKAVLKDSKNERAAVASVLAIACIATTISYEGNR